jgi:pimeloyl-ACP methyl ester carboxylesterase
MANFDLPSMINYILKTTGERQLIYVGHSQGTMIAFSGLSKNKDLDSKIKLFIALGPVAQLNHMKSPIRFLADLGIPTNQQIWYTIFGKRDFMPSSIKQTLI